MHSSGIRRGQQLGWLVAGALSMVTAGLGVLDREIYLGLIAPSTRAGAFSQDVITVIAGSTLCGLGLARTRCGPKLELVALGLLGYLLYGYGIYVIERVYNVLYLNYLLIFGLAGWLVVLGSVDLVRRTAERASLPPRFRRVSACVALLQPMIFYPLWISMLTPLMVHREQIDSLYSVFILDLALVMPAFLLVSVGQFRSRGWALVLAPVMFVLGAVLILSLLLSELVKPAFGSQVLMSGVVPSALLTALFAVVAILSLRWLHLGPVTLGQAKPNTSGKTRTTTQAQTAYTSR